MKLNATLMAIVALAATRAAAVPEPEAKAIKHAHFEFGFCGYPGEGCAKRSADDTEVTSTELAACNAPGAPCNKMKRAAEAVAEALGEAQPIRHAHFNLGFCGYPGEGCAKKREVLDDIVEGTSLQIGELYEKDWQAERVGFPNGEPAFGKHNGQDPLAEADEHRKAVVSPLGQHLLGRSGNALNKFCHHHKKFCHWLKSPHIAANPKPKPKTAHFNLGFCGYPGEGCAGGKKRAIVEAIKEADPAFVKAECFAEGEACDTLIKLQQKIKGVKKEAEAIKDAPPAAKAAFCRSNPHACGPFGGPHVYAAKHNAPAADEAERDCYKPGGACTQAEQGWAKLERSVDEAVESLDDGF